MTLHPLTAQVRASVEDDHVAIHELTVFDPQVVRALSDYAARTGSLDVGDHVEALLELGAKAAALGSAAVDIDQIRRSLETFTGDVKQTAQASVTEIRQAVDLATDEENGTITKVVNATLDKFSEDVAAVVSGEDAPIRLTVQKAVKQVSDNMLGEIQRVLATQSNALKTMLASDNPTSPINALKLELMRSEHETREQVMKTLGEITTLVEVAKATRTAMEKTAIKGLDYEDAVVASLTDMALNAGDTVEATGTTIGLVPRSKKGDAVVTLSSAAARRHDINIVMEAKDMTLSCQQWKTELDEGRKNRGAVAGLGIARSVERMPGQRRVLILDPLNVVIAYDPEVDSDDVLFAAYHLLRTQAACTILDGEGDDLDVTAIKGHIEASLELLDGFDKIERATSNARKQLDELSKTAEKLHGALDKRVRGALTLLDGAPTNPGS